MITWSIFTFNIKIYNKKYQNKYKFGFHNSKKDTERSIFLRVTLLREMSLVKLNLLENINFIFINRNEKNPSLFFLAIFFSHNYSSFKKRP